MCKSQNCLYLKDFCQKIYDLKFKEKPDYDYLRWLLKKNLLDIDVAPNKQFDWIQKLEEGKFSHMNDLYIDMVKIQSKRGHIKLSERIKDLKISEEFLKEINNKK